MRCSRIPARVLLAALMLAAMSAAAENQRPASKTPVSREMRGIRFRLPQLFNDATPQQIVGNVASANLNAILVSVSSEVLTDKRFVEMLQAAHVRDIEVHAVIATIMPGEIGTSSRSKPDPATHAVNSSGQLTPDFLCPVKPQLQRWVLELAAGMTRLGVDGVQLDFIRFGPLDLCYCDLCQRLSQGWVRSHPGRTREDWRDAAISELVDKVRVRVKNERPEIVFSCSTWTVGAGQRRTILTSLGEGFGWRQGQDFMKLRDQTDFLRPMLYNAMLERNADWVVEMTRLGVKNAEGRTKIIPGLILMPGPYLSPEDLARIYPQILAAGGGGIVFYSYSSLFGSRAGQFGYLDVIRRLFAAKN